MLMKLTPAQQLIPQSQFNNLRCRTTITMPFTKIWLNLLMVVWSWIKPIFANAFLAAKKNENCFKSGQKRIKNNHLASLDLVRDNPWKIVQFKISYQIPCLHQVCQKLLIEHVEKGRWHLLL